MKVILPPSANRFTNAEIEQLRLQMRQQIIEMDEQYNDNLDAMILYTLHTSFGFGKKRLRRFYDAFSKNHAELRKKYEMNEGCWLARKKLLAMGIDVEAWNKELKETEQDEVTYD